MNRQIEKKMRWDNGSIRERSIVIPMQQGQTLRHCSFFKTILYKRQYMSPSQFASSYSNELSCLAQY